MHVETEKIEYEDINGYKKSSGFDLSGGINVSQSKGTKAKLGGHASAGYHRSYAKQKISSTLGQGTVIERSGHKTDIKRGTAKSPLNYLDTKTEMKVDSKMVELTVDLAVNPVKVGKEVWEDGKKVYTVAEGIVETAIGAPKYGLVGTAKQLQNTFVDLQTITTLAANEEHADKINNATQLNAEELQQTLDDQFDYQQKQAGIAEKDRAKVNLYQGDDQAFDNNAKAGNFRHYKGGYDQKNNQVYVNTDKTDIGNGTDMQRVLFTEQQRKETHDSKRLNKLSEKQQQILAYDRGDRAAKMWERFSEPAGKPNSISAQEWNQRNKASLDANNKRISQVNGEQVKPRVLEKLDPRYLIAKAKGDEAKAQAIKEEWEKVEKDMVDFGAGAVDAFLTNQVGGVGRAEDGSALFKQGQTFGDVASLFTGGVEVIGGSGMAA